MVLKNPLAQNAYNGLPPQETNFTISLSGHLCISN